jgi:hypothetical protein
VEESFSVVFDRLEDFSVVDLTGWKCGFSVVDLTGWKYDFSVVFDRLEVWFLSREFDRLKERLIFDRQL